MKKLSIQKFCINCALYNNLEHQTSLKVNFCNCVFADDNSAVPETVEEYTDEEVQENDIGNTHQLPTHQSPTSDGKPYARAETPEFSILTSTVETPAAVVKPPSSSTKAANAARSAAFSMPKAAKVPKQPVADDPASRALQHPRKALPNQRAAL
jgi:hypothetical protein